MEATDEQARRRSNALLIDENSTSLSANNSLSMSDNPSIVPNGSPANDNCPQELSNGHTDTHSKPYVNIGVISEPDEAIKTSVSFSGQGSDRLHNGGSGVSKLRLLDSHSAGGGCARCQELQGVVSLWELGVSGLTRSYSKILSELNKARESAIKLEAQVRETSDMATASISMRNLSVGRKTVGNRSSMYEHIVSPPPGSSITDRMYPSADEEASVVGKSKYYKDLTSHLGQAIDLCQQLAAANFKKNQTKVRTDSKHAKFKRQPTMPTISTERPTPHKPLQSITEGGRSRHKLERSPSLPDEILRSSENERCASVEKDSAHLSPSPVTQPRVDPESTLAPQKPFYSHMMKLCSQDELDRSMETSGNSSNRSFENSKEHARSGSTFSDTDVKQIMSKIADLEEERLKLHNTIDDLQKDNNQVRLSFTEILGDLENKDLQLTLALQDLTIATGEIRRAAEMRKKLQDMEVERNALYERLSNLEDESAAVKVSLIQLLQQKSATNKTLALENWRLNQRIKNAAIRTDIDTASINSGFSAIAEDATLQEAYIGADDVASFVHKQGFLVKQGGRRKNWKRRLFVLCPNGLSYFKTEQPIQRVPIDQVTKVQICHGKMGHPHPHPHIFEVHIPGRVFLLSAPTEDEMQSWVGMIQTLKQYNKGTTLNREATLRRAEASAAESSPRTSGPAGSPLKSTPHPRDLGVEALSSSDEVLAPAKEPFSSDDDSAYTTSVTTYTDTPKSVPTLTPLEDDDGTFEFALPKVKSRADST